MRNHLIMCAAVLVAAIAATSIGAETPPAGAAQTTNSWLLGEDAETKANPLTADAKTLAAGKAVYKDKCQRCHGPGGLGDGPDSEPEAREDMDLTNPKRAERNPDGVVYYKVLNGRKRPNKMPAFKDDLTEQQIWSVVTFAQSLRKQP
jgi:mono/diheme cytochrome c family protein